MNRKQGTKPANPSASTSDDSDGEPEQFPEPRFHLQCSLMPLPADKLDTSTPQSSEPSILEKFQNLIIPGKKEVKPEIGKPRDVKHIMHVDGLRRSRDFIDRNEKNPIFRNFLEKVGVEWNELEKSNIRDTVKSFIRTTVLPEVLELGDVDDTEIYSPEDSHDKSTLPYPISPPRKEPPPPLFSASPPKHDNRIRFSDLATDQNKTGELEEAPSELSKPVRETTQERISTMPLPPRKTVNRFISAETAENKSPGFGTPLKTASSFSDKMTANLKSPLVAYKSTIHPSPIKKISKGKLVPATAAPPLPPPLLGRTTRSSSESDEKNVSIPVMEPSTSASPPSPRMAGSTIHSPPTERIPKQNVVASTSGPPPPVAQSATRSSFDSEEKNVLTPDSLKIRESVLRTSVPTSPSSSGPPIPPPPPPQPPPPPPPPPPLPPPPTNMTSVKSGLSSPASKGLKETSGQRKMPEPVKKPENIDPFVSALKEALSKRKEAIGE